MALTIRHVGPSATSFTPSVTQSHSGRILELTRAGDSARLYAGTFAGVWRSDDAGRSWAQLTRPQPSSLDDEVDGALFAPHVHALAASPWDPDLVLASGANGQFSASRDGIYRSTDGGRSWVLAHPVASSDFVSQIVFAPDDALMAYAAIGSGGIAISADAGATWTRYPVGGSVWHIAVAPQEASGIRRAYATGEERIYLSLDGGLTWTRDAGDGAVRDGLDEIWNRYVRNPPEARPTFGNRTADSNASAAQILAIEPANPRRVYLAAPSGANGPGYYAAGFADGTIRNVPPALGAGEASLWYGNFDDVEATGAGQWTQLPGPPLYHGVTTPSGNAYVVTKRTDRGYLLFFSDLSSVHVAAGKPAAAASWHRLDGLDASAVAQAGSTGNHVVMHPDPHAFAVSGDFEITLERSSAAAPYDQNSVLGTYLRGTLWTANDGGVVWSEDGGRSWTRAIGLDTIDAVNLAGLHRSGLAPALYMGVVDNDDFCTLDGGASWHDPRSNPGDGDAWFADVAQRRRVLEFLPSRGGSQDSVNLISPASWFSVYPDPTSASANHVVPSPRASNARSGAVVRGFRPIILTLASESSLPDGDYVFVGARPDDARVVLRTQAITTITAATDWDDPAKAQQVGPPVPPRADVLQVSGGHASPVFYLSDSTSLWKLDEAAGVWQMIVPGGPPGAAAASARRFYADPYNPDVLYILDYADIKVSLDGGISWIVDRALTRVATADFTLTLTPAVLRDMLFVRGEPFTCFAMGNAGVAYTVDGLQWDLLLSSQALPGRPEAAFFDPVSDSFDRALYVACEGRGVLRISPVPALPHDPPASLDLMTFAAILADA